VEHFIYTLQIKKIDTPVATNNNNNNTEVKKTTYKQTDIIGLAYSYAKDLMIASMQQGTVYKKIPEDFIKIATPIYNKMNEEREKLKNQE